MLEILEFVFSGPFKFLGCFFILLLFLALIEGVVANICTTIMTIKKIKYLKEIDRIEEDIKEEKKPDRHW